MSDKGRGTTNLPLPPEGSTVALCSDGRYRWRGTVDMWHNPTYLYLILKCVGIIGGGLAVVSMGALYVAGINLERLGMLVAIVVGVFVFVVLLALAIYAIFAAVLGGWYAADYQMDETGLIFTPASREARLAKGAAAASAVASFAAGNYGVTAASIASLANEAATTFSSVRKIKGVKKHGCIKVSELMLKQQVYVTPEDYDFVFTFIAAHCPKARVWEV